MTRKRKGTHFRDILKNSLSGIEDPELLTLRAHAMMEAILFHLLAAKLSVPESQIPQLSMYQLVDLVLPSPEDTPLRNAIMRFTRIRNTVAHSLQIQGYTREMQEFARELETECLPKEPAKSVIGPYREGLKALLFTVALKAKIAIEPTN